MLLLSLCDFAFELLLGVKGVQLRIDLFFEHALLNLAPLINKLLLAFDLSTHNVEFRVFLSQSIVAHLELLVELALDESLAFILAIGFQLSQNNHGEKRVPEDVKILILFVSCNA